MFNASQANRWVVNTLLHFYNIVSINIIMKSFLFLLSNVLYSFLFSYFFVEKLILLWYSYGSNITNERHLLLNKIKSKYVWVNIQVQLMNNGKKILIWFSTEIFFNLVLSVNLQVHLNFLYMNDTLAIYDTNQWTILQVTKYKMNLEHYCKKQLSFVSLFFLGLISS